MDELTALSLQSGSNGNCFLVQAGNTSLLFDAGISAKCAIARLNDHFSELPRIDGLFVSHEHNDHLRSAGIFHRRFGARLHMSRGTAHAAKGRNLGKIAPIQTYAAGQSVIVGDLLVQTIKTPHDASEGTCFTVRFNNLKIGIFTDLGHPFAQLETEIKTLDGVFLESNYDPEMLQNGPYPPRLKARISGPCGHISNQECGQLLKLGFNHRLQWACLAHLSAQNNTPDKAMTTVRHIVGAGPQVLMAPRDGSSQLLAITTHSHRQSRKVST